VVKVIPNDQFLKGPHMVGTVLSRTIRRQQFGARPSVEELEPRLVLSGNTDIDFHQLAWANPDQADSLGVPSISGGNVAFTATLNQQHGIYVVSGGGTARPVVTTQTLVPKPNPVFGFAMPFLSFTDISLDGDRLAFSARGDGSPADVGVYGMNIDDANPSLVYADNWSSYSTSTGTGSFSQFASFSSPSLSGGSVVLVESGRQLVFATGSGQPKLLPEPDWTIFPIGVYSDPSFKGEDLAFLATPRRGFITNFLDKAVYARLQGTVYRIVGSDMIMPGSPQVNFVNYSAPDLDGSLVAFAASGFSLLPDQQTFWEGIYQSRNGGAPEAIADLSMAIPNGEGLFTGFQSEGSELPFPGGTPGKLTNVAAEGERVAFVGYGGNGQQGVYLLAGDSLVRIADRTTDRFDGREPVKYSIGSEALSGNSLVFRVEFEDGSSAIYFAELAEVASQPPDISATSLDWNVAQGGVDFGYKVEGGVLPQDTTAALYWASGQRTDTILEPATTPITIPKTTPVGQLQTVHLAPQDFPGGAPPEAKYLLAVVDPDNRIDEGILGEQKNDISVALLITPPTVEIRLPKRLERAKPYTIRASVTNTALVPITIDVDWLERYLTDPRLTDLSSDVDPPNEVHTLVSGETKILPLGTFKHSWKWLPSKPPFVPPETASQIVMTSAPLLADALTTWSEHDKRLKKVAKLAGRLNTILAGVIEGIDLLRFSKDVHLSAQVDFRTVIRYASRQKVVESTQITLTVPREQQVHLAAYIVFHSLAEKLEGAGLPFEVVRTLFEDLATAAYRNAIGKD
jgi:hypothetical protein